VPLLSSLPRFGADQIVKPCSRSVANEPFSSFDLAGVKDLDGFGQLPGAPRAAAAPEDRGWARTSLAAICEAAIAVAVRGADVVADRHEAFACTRGRC